MKIAILCGGKGTRLVEHTEHIPKPLVEIGHRPILWHIMKIYAHFGLCDFVLCLGYKGEKIEQYFTSGSNWHDLPPVEASDGSMARCIAYLEDANQCWRITFVDTGLETNTGGRVRRIIPYVDDDTFLLTYGDGVANVQLDDLLAFHRNHGRIATLTAVRPISQFGVLHMDAQGAVTHFVEKPRTDVWVNGGYFVFDRRIREYLGPDDVLEREPFERLADNRQIMAYCHDGFWECMDTYKDTLSLNALWRNNEARWKIWDEMRV